MFFITIVSLLPKLQLTLKHPQNSFTRKIYLRGWKNIILIACSIDENKTLKDFHEKDRDSSPQAIVWGKWQARFSVNSALCF